MQPAGFVGANRVRRANSLVHLLVGCTVLVMLSACEESGRAVSGSDVGLNTPPPSSAAPGENTEILLEDLDACSLLSEKDLAQLGDNPKKKYSNAGSCHWVTENVKVSDSGFVIVRIDLRPGQSVDELGVVTTGTAKSGKVGDREAKQIAADMGERACTLGFAAGSGRVDVLTTANTTDRACDVADRVAELIEPKVPEPVS